MFKKITAFAAAVVMAAGICTGVPMGTENTLPLAITAEAANSDFVIKTTAGGMLYLAEYKGKGGDIVIPYDVEVIDNEVFKGNDKITSVTFPNHFLCVNKGAFSACKNLKTIVFGGDAMISDNAFLDCINLESVTVKGSIKEYIGNNAFSGCTKLKTVKISENKNDFLIGVEAFADCHSLTSINIPSKCIKIYGDAFLSCYSLTELTIPAKTELVPAEYKNGNVYEEYFGYALCYKTKSGAEKKDSEDRISFVADGKTSGYDKEIVGWDKDGKEIYSAPKKVTPKKITLYVTKGSPAEKWAKANGIAYKYGNAPAETTTTTTVKTTNVQFTKSVGSEQFTIKWNKFGSADAYGIYLYNASTQKYEFYKTVTGTQCTFKNLKKDTKYSFYVAALEKKNGKYYIKERSQAAAVKTKNIKKVNLTETEYRELVSSDGTLDIIALDECEYYYNGKKVG